MKPAAIRKLVGAWPGVTEDVKWGNDLVFSVGAKMFCAMEASGKGALGFKVEPERFLELTDRPGIVPAPYLARAHWVSIADVKSLPAAELRALLRRSYELVREKLPKKLQRELADWTRRPTERVLLRLGQLVEQLAEAGGHGLRRCLRIVV